MPQLGRLPAGRGGHGVDEVADLLHRGGQLLLEGLSRGAHTSHSSAPGGRTVSGGDGGGGGPHLHGDVVAAGQGQVHGGQRGVLDVPDALVDVVDGVVALPLAWGFVPEHTTLVREGGGRIPSSHV